MGEQQQRVVIRAGWQEDIDLVSVPPPVVLVRDVVPADLAPPGVTVGMELNDALRVFRAWGWRLETVDISRHFNDDVAQPTNATYELRRSDPDLAQG